MMYDDLDPNRIQRVSFHSFSRSYCDIVVSAANTSQYNAYEIIGVSGSTCDTRRLYCVREHIRDIGYKTYVCALCALHPRTTIPSPTSPHGTINSICIMSKRTTTIEFHNIYIILYYTLLLYNTLWMDV